MEMRYEAQFESGGLSSGLRDKLGDSLPVVSLEAGRMVGKRPGFHSREEIRTPDPFITIELLCRLSYSGAGVGQPALLAGERGKGRGCVSTPPPVTCDQSSPPGLLCRAWRGYFLAESLWFYPDSSF